MTLGNAPRYDSSERTPAIHNLDFSLFKTVQIREHLKTELRGEFFNVTNTVLFSSSNSNYSMGNNSFGTITSQSNSPRQSQIGLRLEF